MAAGNAVIGALRVVLGADTAQFETGLKSAQSKLSGFGASASKAAAAAAAGFAAAGIGIGIAVKGAINEADKLGKMAQSIGIPTEELSGLKHAADLSGVSLESLGKGVAKLSRAMVEAGSKPTSEAANAFKALGVSATNADGSLKRSSEVMSEVAGKFEGIKDGAGKTAVAMALFGKSGADLIPLLNSGQAGLAEMVVEARDLGIVISTETAKSAEAFNDNLRRLGVVKEGIIVQLTARMLPALQALSQRMIDAAKSGGVVEAVSGALVKVFEVFARGVMLVADNFGSLIRLGAVFVGAQIGVAVIGMALAFSKLALAVYTTGVAMTLFNAIKTLSLRGILLIAGVIALAAGQFDNMKEKLSSLADAFTSMLPEGAGAGFMDMMKGLGINIRAMETDLTKFGATASGPGTKGMKDISLAAMGGKNALDQYLDSVRKAREGQAAQAAGFGQVAGTAEAFRVVLQGLAVAKAESIAPDQARLTQLYQEAFATQDLAMKMAGLQLTAANMTPWETFQQAMLNNQILFDNGKISAETFARANEVAGAAVNMTWKSASTSLAGSFGEIGNAMSGMSNNWARLAKIGQAIGATVAFVNAYVAASEAFAKTAFPANIAIAAGVLAKGLGMVAAIRGASIPSAAMGGAFTVPGGMGGGDRMRAMIDLEPGELVEVSSNRPGGYQSGSSGAQPTVIQIHFRDAFSREFWGRGIEQINELVGDGYRLQVAPA